MKNKRKVKINFSKFYIPLTCLFLVLLSILLINTKTSYAATKTYTRKQLQDIVVSTALDYYYNSSYADYSQKGLDSKAPVTATGRDYVSATISQRTFGYFYPGGPGYNYPENINSGNHYHIDCSSFVGLVYISSLGYDFSTQYQHAAFTDAPRYIKQGNFYTPAKDKNTYIDAYKNAGRNMSTSHYLYMGKNRYVQNSSTDFGLLQHDTNTNSSNPVILYYRIKYKDAPVNGKSFFKMDVSESEKASVTEKLRSILQRGDIIVYNAGTVSYDKDNKITYKGTGSHAMLYVGDEFYKNLGIIHSTGSDYALDNNNEPLTIGRDSGVALANETRYTGQLFRENSGTSAGTGGTLSFIVIRPLNEICNGNTTNCKLNLTDNANARSTFNNIKLTQYASKNVTYYNDETNKDVDFSKTLSRFNSVQPGDTISYRLYLQNRSYQYGCDPNVPNDCQDTPNYNRIKTVYNNIVVKGTIPENTTFVKTNWADGRCSYDESSRIVTCTQAQLYHTTNSAAGTLNYVTLGYDVKVNDNASGTIVNNGMSVTLDGSTLQMGKIETKINPTYSDISQNTMKNTLDKFETLNKQGKIKYANTEDKGNFDQNLDNLTSMTISRSEFPKAIYYNELGINLSYLTAENIISAIFNRLYTVNYVNSSSTVQYTLSDRFYTKKTDTEVADLTNAQYQAINKMVVKGLYGGYKLHGNDNYDRLKYLRAQDLEYGDIVYIYKNGSIYAYIYCGTTTNDNKSAYVILKSFTANGFETEYRKVEGECDPDTKVCTGISTLLTSLFKDLFVVLRPSQYYGTTVLLEYNGAKESSKAGSSFIANTKYRIIDDITPAKDPYTVTYKYVKTVDSAYPTSVTTTNTFGGWYSNSALTSKVTNTSSLASTSTHTLYAKYNTQSTTLPNPTLNGYTFGGWYKESELTNKVGNGGASYTPSANATLYAKWTPVTYKVTLNNQSATTSGTASVWYIYNTYIGNGCYFYTASTATENDCLANYTITKPTKTGHTFNGYFSEANGSGTKYITAAGVFQNQLWKKVGPHTLYAYWTVNQYTISFNTNGGTTVSPITKNYGETVAKPTNPTKEGHTFAGWYENSNFTGNAYSFTTMPASDKTLYAKWDVNSYTITFNTNGGSTVSPIRKNYGETVTKPADPTKQGYRFAGWYSDPELTKTYSFTTMKKDETLYAKWVSGENIITYVLNGGTNNSSNPTSYVTGSTVALHDPTKQGYTFTGWYSDNSFNNKVESITSSMNSDITLYAKWDVNSYTITFNTNGGTNVAPITQNYGTQVTRPSNPTKNGSTFIDWYENSNFTGAPYVFNTMPSSDKMLYAKWDTNDYTITFDSNGGSDVSPITKAFGESISKPSNPTKEGYTFDNWYENENLTGAPYVFNTMPANNKTLYAKWNLKTYSITYNLNGGTATNPQNYTIETNDITLANPTKEGHTFTGWTGSNGNAPSKTVTIEKGSTGNKSYTANFDVNSYTVTYNLYSDDESINTTIETVLYNQNPIGVTVKEIQWYTFAGWSCNEPVELTTGATIPVESIIKNDQISKIKVKKDIELTQVYEENKYSIKYYAGTNGSLVGNTEESLTHKDNLTVPETKANSGYIFSHWTCDKDITYLETHYPIVIEEGDSAIALEDYDIDTIFYEETILSGNPITAEQMKAVIINDNYYFTAHFKIIENEVRLSDNGATSIVSTRIYPRADGIFAGPNGQNKMTSTENPIVVPKRELKVSYKNSDLNNQTVKSDFLGYFTEDEIQIINENGYLVSGTMPETLNDVDVLYASWEDKKITLPNPTKEGSTFEGWYSDPEYTTKAGDAGAQYEVSENTELYAKWNVSTNTVTYNIIENEKVKKTDTKTINYGNLVETISIDPGYEIVSIKANKNVKTSENTNISAGSEITQEQLPTIIVTEDLTINITIRQANYKIKYVSYSENIQITKNEEKVKYGLNPLGPEYKINENITIKEIIWTADRDIKLKNNTIIKAGEKINEKDIKNVVVESDIEFRINLITEGENIPAPNTFNTVSFIAVTLGILLVVGSGLILFRKMRA